MKTITGTPITLPLVHLNGTGKLTLREDYDAAAEALGNFIGAWGRVEFNARDYYPMGPEAWTKASDERDAINAHIRAVDHYLNQIRQHLYNA